MADLPVGNWSSFKSLCITAKELDVQYADAGDRYIVVGPDANGLNWVIEVPKQIDDPNNPGSFITNPDATDFETAVKPTANGVINPPQSPFALSIFRFAGNGIQQTVPPGATTTVSFEVPGTKVCFITGAVAFFQNANLGDYITAQIVDVNGVTGYPPGTVLATYVNKWYVNPNPGNVVDLETPYAGQLPSGTYIQLNYTSTGASNVTITVNFRLHIAV